MVDWKAELLGSAASPRAGAQGREKAEIQRLIEAEARRQGVNPAYAVAIARQESGLDPTAVGDNGKSLGLFQLQPAAAKDAGIDPARRSELHENIRGGVTYFKQKLQQSDGNVEQALSRYNRGTPTYKGLGDPRYVENVLRHLDGGAPREGLLQYASTPQRETRPAQTSAPIPPADGRSRVPERPSLPQRLASLVSPKGAEAESATLPPGSIDWNRELGLQPQAASPQTTPPTDWHHELSAPPRSPALAAEQRQAALAPWWQRGLQAAAEASPEIALMSPQLPQIEQARAEMSPAEREELRRREGSQSSAGADIGEIAGQMVGSAVLPGFGTAVGGTVGAVTGMTAETLAREGRLPTWKEVGQEAVFSALPEFAESAVRGAGRSILRRLPGGQRIRFDEAARRVRALPGLVFDPQGREEIGDAFEAVRRSGVQLDIAPLRQEIQDLRPGKYADVMAEMRRMDRAQKTGQRYQQLFQNLRQGGGTQVAGWPIGDLQQLRSGLRQRIDQLDHTEARQLLRDVQRSVDDAVDQGIARGRVGTGQTVEQLQEARRQWARLRASEDLGDLIERTITGTPDLSMASLNLRQLADALRRNNSDLAHGVNRALDQTPGARAAFQRQIDDLAQLYRTIELPLTDVAGISRLPVVAFLRQGLSTLLLTEPGQRLFRDAIVNGRGNLSLNLVAEGANAVRRELGLAPLDLFGTGAPQQTETSGAGATPPAAGR